jgi:hypothetical protein
VGGKIIPSCRYHDRMGSRSKTLVVRCKAASWLWAVAGVPIQETMHVTDILTVHLCPPLSTTLWSHGNTQ